jgi:outer membrane lipoprotein-sorting protein
MTWIKVLFLGLVLSLVLIPGPTQARDLSQALAGVKEKAGQVETLTGDFVQTRFLSVFEKGLRSKGRLYLKQPDCLRWEYLEPYEQGLAICGQEGITWDEFSGTREIGHGEDKFWSLLSDQILAWTNWDLERLREDYQLALRQQSPLVLGLRPRSRSMAQVFSQLTVEFQGQGLVRRITMHEPNGDYTRIEFKGLKTNISLPPNTFVEKRCP